MPYDDQGNWNPAGPWPTLLQDADKGLSKALSNTPHAKRNATEAALEIATERAKNAEAELKKWTDVFGHLGAADEVGNMWLAVRSDLDESFARGAILDLEDAGVLNVRADDCAETARVKVAARDLLVDFTSYTNQGA